jgi:hypothetical protein
MNNEWLERHGWDGINIKNNQVAYLNGMASAKEKEG